MPAAQAEPVPESTCKTHGIHVLQAACLLLIREDELSARQLQDHDRHRCVSRRKILQRQVSHWSVPGTALALPWGAWVFCRGVKGSKVHRAWLQGRVCPPKPQEDPDLPSGLGSDIIIFYANLRNFASRSKGSFQQERRACGCLGFDSQRGVRAADQIYFSPASCSYVYTYRCICIASRLTPHLHVCICTLSD